MPVITHQTRKSAVVERVAQSNITALEAPITQLSMTYRGCDTSCNVDAELWEWVEASAESLGVCALSFLCACAEHVKDME